MLCVATCHFNFAQYKRPVSNLRRFVRYMKSLGVPVFGVEIALHEHSLRMEDDPNWRCIRVGPESIMFQKEALLNLCVREVVPACYDKIICLDADLFFENPNWWQLAEECLNRYKIIQPFESCAWTDSTGDFFMARDCCVKIGLNGKWKGHPGFGWGLQRSFFDEVGFYPYAVLGHGDSLSACGMLRTAPFSKSIVIGVGEVNHTNGIIQTWFDKCHAYNDGICGYISGRVVHEYHGSYIDRAYAARSPIAQSLDATSHLKIADSGVLQWTDTAPQSMRDDVLGYFHSRKEDGLD